MYYSANMFLRFTQIVARISSCCWFCLLFLFMCLNHNVLEGHPSYFHFLELVGPFRGGSPCVHKGLHFPQVNPQSSGLLYSMVNILRCCQLLLGCKAFASFTSKVLELQLLWILPIFGEISWHYKIHIELANLQFSNNAQ